MSDIFLAGAGIVVSVGLFLLAYRQTVGARKERINSANAELERLLVRRVVLESYAPTPDALRRLLEAKARDSRVPSTALLSEAQLLNTVYARLLESDLIAPDKREELTASMLPALIAAESDPLQEQEVLEVTESRRRLVSRTTAVMVLMGALASIAGGIVTVLPEFRSLQPNLDQLLSTGLPTVLVSLAVIAVLISIYRIRSTQDETSKQGALDRYIEFERDVEKVLARTATSLSRGTGKDNYDFLIDAEGKRIIVEVKAWKRSPPSGIVADSLLRLANAVQRTGASIGLLVTPTRLLSPGNAPIDSRVRVMTIRELRNFLAHP